MAIEIQSGIYKTFNQLLTLPIISRGLAVVGVALSLSACAHTGTASRSTTQGSAANIEMSSKSSTDSGPSYQNDSEIVVRGIRLENTQFDYPITINTKVEQWVDYFTGRGRKHFERYLERSELFIPFIRPLLKQNGMPEDLVYLAMIESGFNNHARSHAKAVGPWQFISATGKRYGLMINWWVDERRDTRKSTLAAIEYLKELNRMFQSWELAAAAYNAGESKVARAIRRFGTKDFWALTRNRFFRPETRDYVPKIIAAAIVAKNRTQFGFVASRISPETGVAVAGDGEVVKLEHGTAQSDAEELSQELSRELEDPAGSPISTQGSIAKILKGEADLNADDEDAEGTDSEDESPLVTSAALTIPQNTSMNDSTESAPLARPIPTPHVSKSGEVKGEALAEFEVQSPADLLKVARAAGLSYHTVKSLNPELLRWCTPPSVSTYRIKLPDSVKDQFLTEYNHPSFQRQVRFLGYSARKGETLGVVARRFGIRVDPIADLNGLSSKMPLRKGSRILLPIPDDRSRSLASLEVKDPPERKKARRVRRHHRSPKVSFKRRQAARASAATFIE